MHLIHTDEAKIEQEQGIPLINVLPKKYYDEKHIADTPNVPIDSDDFIAEMKKVVESPNKAVIVYCGSSDCDTSRRAAEKLEAAGFIDVREYVEGTAGWEEAGLPIASGKD